MNQRRSFLLLMFVLAGWSSPLASSYRPFSTLRRVVRSTTHCSCRMTTTPSPNRWNDRYAESDEDYAYGTAPNDFWKDILPTLRLETGAQCLFLAEGEGRNAVYGAQQGLACTAVDNSPVGLQKALRLAHINNVTITTVLMDLNEYNLGTNQWDCIVCIFMHIDPVVRDKVLNAIPHALRINGSVVLEGYTPEQLQYQTGGPSNIEWMYSTELLHKCFHSSTVNIVRNERVIRTVVEGKYHTGKASVVQFVGTKQ